MRSTRRTRLDRRSSRAAVLTAALAFSPLGAATPAGPLYAIKGARDSHRRGAPIAGGTIVMRNGVIEDVGANVTAPADAHRHRRRRTERVSRASSTWTTTRRSKAAMRRQRRPAAVDAAVAAARGGATTFATLEEAERAKRDGHHAAALPGGGRTCAPRTPALQQLASAGVTTVLAVAVARASSRARARS